MGSSNIATDEVRQRQRHHSEQKTMSCSKPPMGRDFISSLPRKQGSYRAKSEFVRDSPCYGRPFGRPDYRCSSIELRSTSPWTGSSSSYSYPRTTKRVISITSLHSNDGVPLRVRETGPLAHNRATLVSDLRLAYPSTLGETQGRPSTSRQTSFYTPHSNTFLQYQTESPARANYSRLQDSSPVRYSAKPRFQSRFLQ